MYAKKLARELDN